MTALIGSDCTGELPGRWAPSRLKDFLQCPQLFYYKTVEHRETPNTIATTRGTLAHTCLECLFDHPRDERTVETALSYLRPAWQVMTDPDGEAFSDPEAAIRGRRGAHNDEFGKDGDLDRRDRAKAADYLLLAPPGSEAEVDVLAQAEKAVRGYFEMEHPEQFDPAGRELHVQADITDVTFHGFIDRLDKWETSNGEPRYAISDYKTGSPPGTGKAYSQQTLDRITEEAFFAMKVYALLWFEQTGVIVNQLRLVYLGAADRERGILRRSVDEELLEETRAKLAVLWMRIKRAAETGRFDPKPGPLCGWCHFRDICPAFANDSPAVVVEQHGATEKDEWLPW